MRMVLGFTLDVIHGVGSRDDLAGCGAQRVHVRLGRAGADEHLRERLPVDVDGDGRGELLFRQVSDAGSAFVIYRVIGDRLYPLFQGTL